MRVSRIARKLARPLAQRPGEVRFRKRRGPELAPAFGAAAYTLTGTGVTQDANGIHFSGASNLAAASKSSAGLEDNATYEVVITIANLTLGKAQVMLYGPTTNHLGQGAELTANGTYTFQVTTNATGTVLNTLRVRATGTSGNNTFDITKFSVKKVL